MLTKARNDFLQVMVEQTGSNSSYHGQNKTLSSIAAMDNYGASSHFVGTYQQCHDNHFNKYNDTQVWFLRPDGDIETKDIQWCLDSGFFQVDDGLWSGNWYNRTHTNKGFMHQACNRETYELRSTKKTQNKYSDEDQAYELFWERLGVGSSRQEDRVQEQVKAEVLQNDIARTPYGNTGGMGATTSQQETYEMFWEKLGVGSVIRQENGSQEQITQSSRQQQQTTTPFAKVWRGGKAYHGCKGCAQTFASLAAALPHYRKCCPEILAPAAMASKEFSKMFCWETPIYSCFLCSGKPHSRMAEKYDILSHIEVCPNKEAHGINVKYNMDGSVKNPENYVWERRKRTFVCDKCGYERGEWKKCIEHMYYCCPDRIFSFNKYE